jgi:hypothetical protein
MRKLIWLPIAGFLLVAGAAVAAAAVPPALDRVQGIIQAADASPAPSSAPNASRPSVPSILDKVLADLVSKGTITQAQADAITGGLQDEIAARRTALQNLRQQWQQVQAQIQQFLADGVITQAEIDTLPADNPLRQAFDSIAQNGQITQQQLQELMPFGGGWGRGGPFGHGFGPRMWGGWPDTDNSQSPSATPTP